MAKKYDDLNSVLLEGILSSDPTEHTTGITKHCRFELGNNSSKQDKEGQYVISTTNIQIRVFDTAGKMCLIHLKKGSIVRIRGRIEEETYRTKHGYELNKTYIRANHVEFRENRVVEDET